VFLFITINYRHNELTEAFGVSLGSAIKAFTSLKSFELNVCSYSLSKNNLGDEGIRERRCSNFILGFIGIVKAIASFSESLMNLEFNVGCNKITDAGIVEMCKSWREVGWKNLTSLRLGFYKNEIKTN